MITTELKAAVAIALNNKEVAEWYAEQHGINSVDDVTDSVIARMICNDAGI